MNKRMEKVTSLAITIMLLASFAFIAMPVKAQTTTLRLIPTPAIATFAGQQITLAGVVEDINLLAGVGLQITWNNTFFDYVSRTMTMPVETFSAVQPPSPYAGLIHAPYVGVADLPNQTTGTYDVAGATLGGAPFNGSGTAFTIVLEVISLPWASDFGGAAYVDFPVEWTLDDLADPAPTPIPHVTVNGTIRLDTKTVDYDPLPMLKVMPETIECEGLGENCTADVYLMDENGNDLTTFWDVAGIDVYMNFDPTMITALEVTIDPDGWFGGFWTGGGMVILAEEINNIAGTVHVAFTGYGTHSEVYGTGRMFSVIFNSTTESETLPLATSPVTLENPQTYVGEYVFDSIGGLIDHFDPVGSMFNQLTKHFLEGQFELISWEDNGDGELSASDQFILNDTLTGEYYDYHLDQITGTLNLTMIRTGIDYLWSTNSIPLAGLANNGLPGTTTVPAAGACYNGFGLPNWTGNFTLPYPVDSVNSIIVTALPFTGDQYTYALVEGVDFVVHADDDLIELLIPIDVPIVNEHWMDGVNNTLNGWPYINYVANSIQSVHVDKHEGAGRQVSPNAGYASPAGDWWYDPDWPWELEGWYELGYFPGGWPAGSEWWINYTACSYMTVDWNTDPTSAYVEFDGSYADFLALCNPINTTWNERYPKSWQSYTWEYFTDLDNSTCMTVGDLLIAPGNVIYQLDGVGTDLITLRKPWIVMEFPETFFGMAPIVEIAGFPRPDKLWSPWLEHPWAVKLPHVVENAIYEECFHPLGGAIDIYTQYPDPFGGQGPNKPSDMFWPQKGITICANVTYADWPEQNKDVAFQVIDPNGLTWGIWVNRTNDDGVACVFVRMPWPCDDPENQLGEWTVIATVDVACIVVNDTLTFKYDYKVNIWDAHVDDVDSYKHCEWINVTIYYGSYALLPYSITFAITAVDASGVPFGYDFVTVEIGGHSMSGYCQYFNGTEVLSVHVQKWARPPVGRIYVVGLSGLPSEGGSAETPVFVIVFSIEAE